MHSNRTGSDALTLGRVPLRYGLAVLTASLAVGIWLLAGQRLASSPFVLLAAAVAFSAWYGGLGPALVATALSCLASAFLYVPHAEEIVVDDRAAPLHLLTFLLVCLLIAALQVRRQRAEAALTHQALHDSLTGLPNRLLFGDRLGQAIRAAHRERGTCALLLLDLDGFKGVNDTFGHIVGDLLLQQVGARLRAIVRESDTAARLGGDEFALVLPGADERGATLMAQRVLGALREPFEVSGERMGIGCSVGVAVYPEQGATPEALLERADAAMYWRKRGGGGQGGVLPGDGRGRGEEGTDDCA